MMDNPYAEASERGKVYRDAYKDGESDFATAIFLYLSDDPRALTLDTDTYGRVRSLVDTAKNKTLVDA